MTENKIELSGIFSEGYGIIPKKLMRSNKLDIYEKAILAYMLSFTGGGNECFPSYEKMADELGISKSTLSIKLKHIINNGFIKKEKLYPNNPLKHNNKYVMQFFDSPVAELSTVRQAKQRSTTGGLSLSGSRTSNNNSINNNNKLLKNDLVKQFTDILSKSYIELYGEKPSFIQKDYVIMNSIVKKAIELNKDNPLEILSKKIEILSDFCRNDKKNFWKLTPGMMIKNWLGLVRNNEKSIYPDLY